jgi:hypothetical protein
MYFTLRHEGGALEYTPCSYPSAAPRITVEGQEGETLMYPLVLAVVPLALQQLGLALAIIALLLWLAALFSRALVLRRSV